jgi:hypothetical protein
MAQEDGRAKNYLALHQTHTASFRTATRPREKIGGRLIPQIEQQPKFLCNIRTDCRKADAVDWFV